MWKKWKGTRAKAQLHTQTLKQTCNISTPYTPHTQTIRPKTHHTHSYKPYTHTNMKIRRVWCYKHSKNIAHWDCDNTKTTSSSYCSKHCGTLQEIIQHHVKSCKHNQELQHNQTWPLTHLRTMACPLFESQTAHTHCLAHNCLMGNAATAGVPKDCKGCAIIICCISAHSAYHIDL